MLCDKEIVASQEALPAVPFQICCIYLWDEDTGKLVSGKAAGMGTYSSEMLVMRSNLQHLNDSFGLVGFFFLSHGNDTCVMSVRGFSERQSWPLWVFC